MNILICGDINIEKGLLIAAMSLVKTNKEPVHFFILTISLEANGKTYKAIPDSFIDFVSEYIKQYNSENSIKKFDVTQHFLNEKPEINLGTRFTPCCMLRLYADLVPEIPDKILYLDNDIICRRDISSFYETDMTDYDIGGVLDYYGSHIYKKNIFVRDYLNSGVLLLNMKRIRENGFFKNCRHLCMTKKMFLPDQAALNKLTNNKKYFSHIYNDQRWLHKKTCLKHFTTTFRFIPKFRTVTVKPWDIERVHSVLKFYEFDGLLGEYQLLFNRYMAAINKQEI